VFQGKRPDVQEKEESPKNIRQKNVISEYPSQHPVRYSSDHKNKTVYFVEEEYLVTACRNRRELVRIPCDANGAICY
jgi:predicted PilT family ATPase